MSAVRKEKSAHRERTFLCLDASVTARAESGCTAQNAHAVTSNAPLNYFFSDGAEWLPW